ncbi:MAG: SDR family oxidoreductase [Beijerinckiaceae bacterium]|nr:SDR family oxidoreductase [Beijerinckiaceae bacterium]
MASPRSIIIAGRPDASTDEIAAGLTERGWVFDFIDLGSAARISGRVLELSRCAYKVEPTDVASVDDVVSSIFSSGPVDGLVNILAPMRALGVPRKSFLAQSPADWRSVIEVDVYGILNVTRAALTHMTRAGRGAIVSIMSNSGLRGVPGGNAYSAAHAGIQAFTQCMAQDCGDYGVRINSVCANEQEFPPADSTGVVKDPPLGRGRFGADVAAAATFLLMPEASHVTGTCIDVSGGWSLY